MNDTPLRAISPPQGDDSGMTARSVAEWTANVLLGNFAGKPPSHKLAPEHWGQLLQRIGRNHESGSVLKALRQIQGEYPECAESMLDMLASAGWSDPDRPPRPPRKPPTLADARGMIEGLNWIWPGWILKGQLTLVTGASGAGKTTLMVDLVKRYYKGLVWPDGTPATQEPGRPALWLNSDRRVDQLAELWAAAGLPDDACYLAHELGKPLNPLSLDDPSTMSLISEYVESVKPWALIIDTISRATSQDLCNPTGVTEVTGPLLELSNRTGIAVFLLGHTNKDGEAYGRHLKTTCQVCWKLEGTSATSSRTLRNDDRCAIKPPEPIGVTIQSDGTWKWGEAVNLDESGRTVGCANLIMDLISRNGRTGWKDLTNQCEVAGGYSSSTVSKAAKTLTEVGKLVVIHEVSKNGKPYKLWDVPPVESGNVPETQPAEDRVF